MNKKSIVPNLTQPIHRIPTGQWPNILAELSEDTLKDSSVFPGATGPEKAGPTSGGVYSLLCSYDDE